MQCLTQQVDGSYLLTSPQPTLVTGCVYILAQPNDIQNELLQITPTEGVEIALKLSLILIAGFIFRAIASLLATGSFKDE